MNRPSALLLVVSLLLHALLFVSLPRLRQTRESKTPLVVELADETHSVRNSVSSSSDSRLPHKKARSQTQNARAISKPAGSAVGDFHFAPSFQPRGDLALKPEFTADGDPVDDPASEWGSGGAQFARVSDLGRFDRLYDLIDAHVMYPSVLASHQVSGTVNARLILTPKGTCDWHATKITSTESHLRLYVLDVLKRVCRRDLSRYARRSSDSNLDLSFKFAITEHDDEALKAKEKKVVGNVFLFYRNSQQSVAEWHLGPFKGLFPVPAIMIDFAWLQENYDRVMHSRDPLKEFKSHLSDVPAS